MTQTCDSPMLTADRMADSVEAREAALFASLGRVIYHHRTQGKAVEGVHIRGITDALRAEGVPVDVISLPGADPYSTPGALSPTRQARPWMRLVAKLPEPLFELAEIFYNVISAWRVNGHLSRHRDVRLIYERYSLFMFSTIVLAKLRRIPIVLEVNDSALVERVRPLFFSRIAKAIERWVFSEADGLVFVSTAFLERARRGYATLAPAIVTPNAANLAQFTYSAEQRASARKRLGLDGSTVCGYLGAFVPWHAIDRFVYAISDRLATHPRLKLLLVGDGETFSKVKAFVEARGLQDRVILAGRVPHAEVPSLLAAMDLAVLPSAGDYTSPVKLFEFMAAGIAPVAPDFAPICEVLVDGETGWMFRANDIEACANAVLERAKDAEALARVGGAAREYVKRERQWRNNVLQLADFVGGLRRSTST